MTAGTPPEPGKSRMTISTYRLSREGRRVGGTDERTYDVGDPAQLPDSLTWPPCRCPRCRDRASSGSPRSAP
ncbi:hypothetical protein GCM10010339_34510 [Streptomyces alanosinicus]|uniref:Uncharacterized protein n=1 Tax=Streptomyces alanosinicus TaxID=68171 RepID=A0A918YI87_9ACTN|nr:hypothetical protein GCM10010339_34510 [Streptomyces alanosinicus]